MAQVIQRHVRRRVLIKEALIQRAAFRQHNGVTLRGIRVRQHGIPRLNAELRQCFFRVSRLKENTARHLVVLLVNRLMLTISPVCMTLTTHSSTARSEYSPL